MDKNKQESSVDKAVESYPGVAINVADDEIDTEKLVKERTETLNDNPRSDD